MCGRGQLELHDQVFRLLGHIGMVFNVRRISGFPRERARRVEDFDWFDLAVVFAGLLMCLGLKDLVIVCWYCFRCFV